MWHLDTAAAQERLSALPGMIGFYAKDMASGESFSFQQDSQVNAASVIKLLIMAEAFRQREAGQIDFAEPCTILAEHKLPSCGALTYLHTGLTVELGDLVTLMIILSDNTATNLLIEKLGLERINAMIDSLGLTRTRLNRMLWRPELSRRGIQNRITAGDMGRLMELLLRGEVVSAQASAEMLRIMGDQRLNGKMPFFLHSEGIRCAHKTGEDDGITHDVGVIYAEAPRIFCFVSEGTDVPCAERLLQDLAAEVGLG